MSAAPRLDPSLGLHGLRMTADEYLALGETSERYELVDGVVIMSPSPFANRNEIAAEIVYQLKAFARESGAARVFPETDVRLSDSRVYCPDVSVYLASRLPAGSVKRLTLPPDLVVEVLSGSTKAFDLITKRADYAKFGVREYWVVDPSAGTVRRWVAAAGDGFEDASASGNNLASASIPGFTLDLKPIRALAG